MAGLPFCWVQVLCKFKKKPLTTATANRSRTRPTVDVLAKSGVKVTVACRTLEKAQGLAKGIPNTNAISVRYSIFALSTQLLTIASLT